MPSKYAMAGKISREWSPSTAETIEKEFERIYKATQIAGDSGGTVFTNGLDTLSPAASDLIVGQAGGTFALKPFVATAQRALTNDGGVPTWAQIALATGVTGKLPLANLVDFAATQRVWGRNSAGTGVAEEVTFSQFLDWVGSAAEGDILYRNATVWTRLAKGTASQVLLGGNAPSWGTLTQNLSIASITLSNTQLQTLNTVPVTVVAAPGAGIVVVPVQLMYKGVRSGSAFTGDSSPRIRWNGIATDLTSNPTFTWNSAVAASLFRFNLAITSYAGSTSDDPRNKALEVSATANLTGGSGNSLEIRLSYFLATGL